MFDKLYWLTGDSWQISQFVLKILLTKDVRLAKCYFPDQFNLKC